MTTGERVRFTGKICDRHGYAGRTAIVRRYIKSRDVVEIQWEDDGKRYDAMLGNLEPVGGQSDAQ